MTHNRQATSLIELSIYLLILNLLGYLTFSLAVALSTHARSLYIKTNQCCMVYTALQLIRIDLMNTQQMQVTPSGEDLLLQTATGHIVWRYEVASKKLIRMHEHQQNNHTIHDRSLILEHLDAWQLKPFKQRLDYLDACSLQITYASHNYDALLFIPLSESEVA